MIEWLLKHFVPDYQDVENPRVRERYGRLGSVTGIAANLLLFGGKFAVGSLTRSVAITADAVNNLSDAGSSVISLISFRLSGKPADKEHPFGHARIEYIASMAVAILILLLGGELAKSSVEKILHPEAVLFTPVMIWVLVGSILVKLGLFAFNRNLGRRIGSPVMAATAADSLSDVLATSAVLAATLVGHFTQLLVDGWVGVVVACFILWSGVGIIRDAMDKLLGDAPSAELIETIENFVMGYEGIIGVHDLVVHNYGPGRCFASLHAEVPASEDILVSHDIIDNIERDIAQSHGIHLVIHLDPVVTDDPEVDALRARVRELVEGLGNGLSIHDFRLVKGATHYNLIFDVAVPIGFSIKDQDLLAMIQTRIRKWGDYYPVVTLDRTYVSAREESMS